MRRSSSNSLNRTGNRGAVVVGFPELPACEKNQRGGCTVRGQILYTRGMGCDVALDVQRSFRASQYRNNWKFPAAFARNLFDTMTELTSGTPNGFWLMPVLDTRQHPIDYPLIVLDCLHKTVSLRDNWTGEHLCDPVRFFDFMYMEDEEIRQLYRTPDEEGRVSEPDYDAQEDADLADTLSEEEDYEDRDPDQDRDQDRDQEDLDEDLDEDWEAYGMAVESQQKHDSRSSTPAVQPMADPAPPSSWTNSILQTIQHHWPTAGAGSEIKQTGAGSEIKQTGAGLEIKQTGAGSEIKQTGAGSEIKQTGAGSEIKQTGVDSFAGDDVE